MLRKLGYTVLDAANGPQALELFEKARGAVDLLLSDVVMPGIGGKDLAEKLRELAPALQVLFMSGYTPTAFAHRRSFEEGAQLLQKPFTADSLARKVRQVLGDGDADVAAELACRDTFRSRTDRARSGQAGVSRGFQHRLARRGNVPRVP